MVPAVSVIIPAYRTAQYIDQALSSVWAQSFQDFEVLVINDGSPDTLELERVLQPYMNKMVYLKQPNEGPSSARNTGIRNSAAPLIALLDSDDYWDPEYLATQTRILGEDPSIDAVYSNAIIFGDAGAEDQTYMDLFPSEGDVTFLALVTRRCNVVGAGVVMRRAMLERIGLYDPNLRLAEDLDLWLRVLKHGGRIVYHRQSHYYIRRHADSSSRDSIQLLTSVLEVLEKNAKLVPLIENERAAIEAARQQTTSSLLLERGRKAFLDGDVLSAIRDIADANKYQRRWKLRFVLALMRVAPGLLRWTMRLGMRRHDSSVPAKH